MRITVTGTSTVTLPAECVAVTLTLGFSGADREPVIADTAALADRLRARLAEAVASGAARDLTLSGLRTWTATPVDERGRPAPAQHTAEVRGSVVLDDLTVAGPLLGELATVPGVQIGLLDWRLRDATVADLQPRALADAFGRARRRAEWIAAAAGAGSLEVVSITDGGAPGTFARSAMRMAEAAPSFDLDPGEVDLSATLTVDFDAR